MADTRTEADLLERITELQEADDDRWNTSVMDLIDDIAHVRASQRVNAGGDYDEEHDEADRTRSELHNSSAESIVEWLLGQLSCEAIHDELDARS